MELHFDVAQSGAAKGDLLLVVLVRTAPVIAPAGWETVALGVGDSGLFLDAFARAVDDDEPGEAVFVGGNDELQGQLLVLRGGSPSAIVEYSAHVGFTSDTTPDAPTVDVQQAIDLVLCVWSVAGEVALVAPSGWIVLDTYTTEEVSKRTILLACRVSESTGTAIALPSMPTVAASTGRSFALVLRDRPPHRPAALEDPVPGNIGLLA